MAKLEAFESLDVKKNSFRAHDHFIIDTKNDFDLWFNNIIAIKAEERTNFIFRGMKEAKHKLYTSGQRQWLENDMTEWAGMTYLNFIYELVNHARNHPLLEKVFDVYNYSATQREFPILSILQHYGGPTPLMDWTYNINVALFFATENLSGGHGTNSIDNYFSIYFINKSHYKNELLNLLEIDPTGISGIKSFNDWTDDPKNPNKNGILYISDFDEGNIALQLKCRWSNADLMHLRR